VVLTLAGALALVVFAVRFEPTSDWRPVLGFASLGLSLVAVGGYAFRSAHTLWGRFDFESTLTWVEMEGSFIRSKVDIGNRLQDRVFTEREVVNVENMTFRVWVMQLRSVVFGHQSHGSVTPRIITGMLSQPKEAEYLKNLVRQFAGEQSIVIAPTANEDARRMAAMVALNQLGAAAAPAAGALASGIVAETLLQAAAPAGVTPVPAAVEVTTPQPASEVVCGACETVNDSGNAFCESCGKPILAT